MTPKQAAIKDIQKDVEYPHPIMLLKEKDIMDFLNEDNYEDDNVESS